jgi:hypothetical protein
MTERPTDTSKSGEQHNDASADGTTNGLEMDEVLENALSEIGGQSNKPLKN